MHHRPNKFLGLTATTLLFLTALCGPAQARYAEADPINRAGGPNMYAYVLQNPLKYVDLIGLATMVITGGWPDHSANIFGHVAISFTGAGLYSYGTSDSYGSSVTDYLKAQLQIRDMTITIINTDPVQEALMVGHYQANFNGPSSHYSVAGHSCADAALGALQSAGLVTGYPGPNIISIPYDAQSAAQQIPGSQTYTLPKGSPVPDYIDTYNK